MENQSIGHLQGTLKQEQAHAVFDKEAKTNFFLGNRKKMRLQLKEGDAHFNIAARALKGRDQKLVDGETKLGGRLVATTLSNGTRVLLNVNSAAKRLHLSNNEVIQLAANGGEGLQKHISSELAKLEGQFNEYDRILAQYADDGKTQKGEHTGLSKKNLRTIVAVALTTKLENRYTLLQIGKKKTGISIIAGKDASGKLEIFTHTGRVVESTKSSTITELFSITAARTDRALQVLHEKQETSRSAEILKQLHKDGSVPGIQDPPHFVTVLVANEPTKVHGHLKPLQKGNLRQIFQSNSTNISVEERVKGFHDLLLGLERMHATDIVHGRITSDHIHRKEGPPPSFVLTEFEEASTEKDREKHYKQLKQTPDGVAKIKGADTVKEYHTLEKQRDVQAMADAVWVLLSKNREYNEENCTAIKKEVGKQVFAVFEKIRKGQINTATWALRELQTAREAIPVEEPLESRGQLSPAAKTALMPLYLGLGKLLIKKEQRRFLVDERGDLRKLGEEAIKHLKKCGEWNTLPTQIYFSISLIAGPNDSISTTLEGLVGMFTKFLQS